MSENMSEKVNGPGTEVAEKIKELEGELQKLMDEEHGVIMDPVLRSSGTLLANRYAFEIEALKRQLPPEQYGNIGHASSEEFAKIQFGSHPEDILVPNYSYFISNKTSFNYKLDRGEGVNVWRKIGERDYIKPS